jgi:hypothetical protein
MLAGANSYRSIHSFIDVHFTRLRKFFRLKWRHAPAYTTIRNILHQLDAASVEGVFRRHAAILHERSTPDGQRHIAVDGKALRLSFDNFCDRKAAHILSAFASDPALVLPFGAWSKFFPHQVKTLAAIDRLVHHATILEMNVESYRRRAALDRKRGPGRPPTRRACLPLRMPRPLAR